MTQPTRHTRHASGGAPLNPVATRYFSLESFRLAGGFTCEIRVNAAFSRRRSSPSAPPASTFATKVPPGSSTSNANSAAASQSPMIRRWSVC